MIDRETEEYNRVSRFSLKDSAEMQQQSFVGDERKIPCRTSGAHGIRNVKPCQVIGPIPEETARVARAAFPKGNLYLRIRDEVGTIYEDPLFVSLFPNVGQPGARSLAVGAGLYLSIP